jgi:hypothetical protein
MLHYAQLVIPHTMATVDRWASDGVSRILFEEDSYEELLKSLRAFKGTLDAVMLDVERAVDAKASTSDGGQELA